MKKTKNFSIAAVYLIANMLNKAMAFITVPIFTRMLTTSEYGTVSTYTSCVLILQYFMGLSSEYTIRNAFIDYKTDIPRYMSAICLLSSVNSLVISGILIFLSKAFGGDILLVSCALIQSFMTFLVNAMSYRLMMEKRHIQRAIYIACPNIISVLLGILFINMMADNHDISRIYGYVCAYFIFGSYILVSTIKEARGLGDMRTIVSYWKYILKLSPPLIIHGLSMMALSQFDRIMITKMASASETGIYSIVYSLSMIVMAVTQALQGVWTPWFTEKYKEKCYLEINKQTSVYLIVVAALTGAIMLVAPEVLIIMTPETYWSGIQMIPPLVISSYFIYAYSFYVGLELHEKKTKLISGSTIIAVTVNVFLNFLLIPKFGALAAAYTTLVAYVLLFILHWRNGQRINKNVFKMRSFITPIMFIIAMTILFYLFSQFIILRWCLAVGIGGFCILWFIKK